MIALAAKLGAEATLPQPFNFALHFDLENPIVGGVTTFERASQNVKTARPKAQQRMLLQATSDPDIDLKANESCRA